MRQQGGLHAEVAIACVFDPHGGCTGVLDGTARSHRHTVEGYMFTSVPMAAFQQLQAEWIENLT